MLIYAMGVSIDGYIADRNGSFDWGAPSEELFLVHLERVSRLSGYLLGRRLYEAMLVWETDPAVRETESGAAFADVWTALPKVVFSSGQPQVFGNARRATRPIADELASIGARDEVEVEIGGATLAATAIEQDLVDEFRIFRAPVIAGGGTPYLPPIAGSRPLEVRETRSFDTGVIYERYARRRDAA